MSNNYKNTNPARLTPSIRRRELLKAAPVAGLGAMGLSPVLKAQMAASGIRLVKIHCFEIAVSDVERTVSFYQDLFGMPIFSSFGGRTCLGIGQSTQFMSVRSVESGESPAITKLGYSVERFDIEWLLEELAGLGIEQIDPPPLTEPGITNANKSWVYDREGTPELYFADGRGVIVQLCDTRYCGGSGEIGEVCENPAESPVAGMFDLTEISHFTAFVNDGAGANTWYQESFGLEVQAYQGAGSPVTGIGDGYQFVMYAGGFGGPGRAAEPTPANLHHGCFNMHGFDEVGVLEKMTEYGITDQGDRQLGPMMHYISRRMPERGGAEGGTPELYFTDPDGILMQLQDITYCGGGGYLGNECLNG